MESTIENVTEMENEKVEHSTDKETVTEEQRQGSVKEIDNENPGDTVGEEEPVVREHKDSPCLTVLDEGSSLASSEVTPSIEEETNDDDPPKIDDEKNSQLETSPQLSPTPLVALNPEEINTTVEDTLEQNVVSGEVSSDILKDNEDAVEVDNVTAVVHEETVDIPDIKLSEEDTRSPHHHADIVMEQEKAAEGHDTIASGDHDEFAVISDTKISEDIGSPHHHANIVMEQDRAAEEHEIISSGDHIEFPADPDAKVVEDMMDEGETNNMDLVDDTIVVEENNGMKDEDETNNIDAGEVNSVNLVDGTKVVEENKDMMDEGETNNIVEGETNSLNLVDGGSGPVDHGQGTTTELDKGPEVPGSETVLELENKQSETLIETSVNVQKEPDMPATENLTEKDQNSDVLPVGVSGDSDKGLSVLPTTQTSFDNDERMAIFEAEPTEDIQIDVPDSKLVADAIVDSANIKDANVEVNTEKQDNSKAPEVNDADNRSALVRLEPGNPCVASPSIKPEARVSRDLNNGAHTIRRPPPACDGPVSARPSFLLDDTSDGNESGTEEDQSAFMKELDNFFREKNMDFKPPKFYGEGLNCLKLWRAVTRLGGYDKVTGSKLWRQVGESFRPPKTCTTVSWTFRGFYEKALLEYERHKVSGGELQIPLASELEPMNIDNQASGSGRARRDAASRAMQGWHSQRLNGNGEVSDPAIKDKNLVVHQKREKHIGGAITPGVLKRKRPLSAEHGAKNVTQVSKTMSDVTVYDVGPPADWVKINVERTQDCFEVYALVPGLIREEVRVQSDPAGRLVISGEPKDPMDPWGATPFKKVVSLPTRIDPHHTSAVVTLNGQLYVRVPLEPLE